MSETATIPVKALKSKYWDDAKQKFVASKQFKDKNGYPVGPVQYFEADSLEELLEKKDAAHENASVSLYEARKANKLGTMLEPDKDEPIQTFEERPLTADERVKVQKLMSDPNTQADAVKILLEAQLGGPLESVRQVLRETEINKRADNIRHCIREFKLAHPEYVESEANRDTMQRYLEKRDMPYTKRNLEIAFEDLKSEGFLTIQAPQAAVPTPTPVQPGAAAPAGTETIPPSSTQALVIPEVPTEVRPKQSSSGLGRDNSSAPPSAAAPKVAGITIREINAMTSDAYAKALREGIPARNITAAQFADAIKELYKR